jgi:hypothetical protein
MNHSMPGFISETVRRKPQGWSIRMMRTRRASSCRARLSDFQPNG